MPHPLDAHAFPPRGFRQTAAVRDGGGSKELALYPREKQVVQQQSCPKCIKGVVRRRMRSLIGKLMALPPLLLTPEGIQAAVHGAPRDRGEAVSVQTLFGKIALDGVKIADCRNIIILPDLSFFFQKKSIESGRGTERQSGAALLRSEGREQGLRRRPCFPFFFLNAGDRIRRGSSSRSPSMTAPNAKCAPLSGNSRCEASPSPMMLEAAAPACALCALMSLICATKPSA